MLEYISEYFVEVLQNIWQSVVTKLQALTDLCIGCAFKLALPILVPLYFVADVNRFKWEKIYFMFDLAGVRAAKSGNRGDHLYNHKKNKLSFQCWHPI